MKKLLCLVAIMSVVACTSNAAPPEECKEFIELYEKLKQEGSHKTPGFTEAGALVMAAHEFGPKMDPKRSLWDGFVNVYELSYEEAKAKGDKMVEMMRDKYKSTCKMGSNTLQIN